MDIYYTDSFHFLVFPHVLTLMIVSDIFQVVTAHCLQSAN